MDALYLLTEVVSSVMARRRRNTNYKACTKNLEVSEVSADPLAVFKRSRWLV